jgi:hypothetical protein
VVASETKEAIFCQTKRIFIGRSSATVKKICEVWRKMGLFWPDSVPPNQVQNNEIAAAQIDLGSGFFETNPPNFQR